MREERSNHAWVGGEVKTCRRCGANMKAKPGDPRGERSYRGPNDTTWMHVGRLGIVFGVMQRASMPNCEAWR